MCHTGECAAVLPLYRVGGVQHLSVQKNEKWRGDLFLAVLCHRSENALAIGGSSETRCIPSDVNFTFTSP